MSFVSLLVEDTSFDGKVTPSASGFVEGVVKVSLDDVLLFFMYRLALVKCRDTPFFLFENNTFMATYSFTYSNPISIIFNIYFTCILSDVSTILCYITNNLLYYVNAVNGINDCLSSF